MTEVGRWVRMAGGDRDGMAVVVCNGDEGCVITNTDDFR